MHNFDGYDVARHYWILSDGRIWSARDAGFVQSGNEQLVAYDLPLTPLLNEGELKDVLVRLLPHLAHKVAPDANDVRAETQRRIIAMTGADSLIGTIVKQSNANMRANELNDIRLNGGTLTAAEQAEADALRGLANAIKQVRAFSNLLEALDPIPTDYTDNKWWTA